MKVTKNEIFIEVHRKEDVRKIVYKRAENTISFIWKGVGDEIQDVNGIERNVEVTQKGKNTKEVLLKNAGIGD